MRSAARCGNDGAKFLSVNSASTSCPRWNPLKECVVFADESIVDAYETRILDRDVTPWFGIGEMPHSFTLAEFATRRRRVRFIDSHVAGTEWLHFMTDLKTDTRPLFTHWCECKSQLCQS